MKATAVVLFFDDSGQDLVEMALLTAVVGFAGLLVLDALLRAIGVTYGSWATGMDDLWETPGPAGS